MKFADDRPAGFPAAVHQESPNSRVVEKLAPAARVLAVWHDKDGKSTDVPAVILSPQSVYVAHVLWSDADADQQTQLLLAAVGHFLPEKWAELVTGALSKAASEAGYENLDQLAQAALKTSHRPAMGRKGCRPCSPGTRVPRRPQVR